MHARLQQLSSLDNSYTFNHSKSSILHFLSHTHHLPPLFRLRLLLCLEVITKLGLREYLFHSKSMEWRPLIQFLCVFSVRKISSILGISVEHGKNVSGWQAVGGLILLSWKRACCNQTREVLNLNSVLHVKYERFYSMKAPPEVLKELETFIQKLAISVFLVEFRAEFQSKILALITFNPKIWLKWDLISCAINIFKWNIAVSVWIGPTF